MRGKKRTTRRGSVAFFALLALCWGHPAFSQQAELRLAQPNAARFPRIRLYALPQDGAGRTIDDIAAERFQVIEDGKPGQVLSVRAKAGKLDVCLVIDRSESMLDEGKIHSARQAASAFLKALTREDRAAVIAFSDTVRLLQPLTDEQRRLNAAVDTIRSGYGMTALYDALYQAIRQVALPASGGMVSAGKGITGQGRADARRLIVVLTDGHDTSSRTYPPQIVRLAQAHGISICTVALGSAANTPELQGVSAATGGISLVAPGPRELRQLYTALAAQLHSEYEIIYKTPRPAADATQRQVSLTIRGVNATAARGQYQAPGQGSLLVVAGPDPAAQADPTAGAPGRASPVILIAGALAVITLVGLLAGALVWHGTRRRRHVSAVAERPTVLPDLPALWLPSSVATVGRGAENDVQLSSPGVSRQHARIETVDASRRQYRVIDLGSGNGTFVNGQQVREADVRPGDRLRFADCEFLFQGLMPAA